MAGVLLRRHPLTRTRVRRLLPRPTTWEQRRRPTRWTLPRCGSRDRGAADRQSGRRHVFQAGREMAVAPVRGGSCRHRATGCEIGYRPVADRRWPRDQVGRDPVDHLGGQSPAGAAGRTDHARPVALPRVFRFQAEPLVPDVSECWRCSSRHVEASGPRRPSRLPSAERTIALGFAVGSREEVLGADEHAR